MEHLYNHYYEATPLESDDDKDIDHDIASDLIYNEIYGRNFTQGFALADHEDENEVLLSDIGAEKEARLLNSLSMSGSTLSRTTIASLSPMSIVSSTKKLSSETGSNPVLEQIKEIFIKRMMNIFIMMFQIIPPLPRHFSLPTPNASQHDDTGLGDAETLKASIIQGQDDLNPQDIIVTMGTENA